MLTSLTNGAGLKPIFHPPEAIRRLIDFGLKTTLQGDRLPKSTVNNDIDVGEEVLRTSMRLAKDAATILENTLRHSRDTMPTSAIEYAEAEIKIQEKIFTYSSHALQNLPEEPKLRAAQIMEHLDNIQFLGSEPDA